MRADAAAGLEHAATSGIARVAMEQIDQRVRLIVETLVFSAVVSVNVAPRHPESLACEERRRLERGCSHRAPAGTAALTRKLKSSAFVTTRYRTGQVADQKQ